MQLVQQIRYAIRSGTLKPGMRLPAAREVVAALTINPNTVFKAYAELERQGLVASRPGLGTFVSLKAPTPISEKAQVRLRRTMTSWLNAAQEAGMEREAALALFIQVLEAVYAEGAA